MRRTGVTLLAMLGLASCEPRDTPEDPAADTQPQVENVHPEATQAAVPAVDKKTPEPLVTLLDVVRHAQPDYPTTQPLAEPVPLNDAARLVLEYPVMLCARGDLWLTHNRGRALRQVLVEAPQQQVHVLPAEPLAVHWTWDEASRGWVPELLAKADAGKSWHHARGSEPLPLITMKLAWSEARSRGALLFVPRPGGLVVLQRTSAGSVHTFDFFDVDRPPVFVTAGEGLLAFVPWQAGEPETNIGRLSQGTANLRTPPVNVAEGFTFTPLGSEAGWPGRVRHVMPMVDGSIIVLHADGEATNRLSVVAPTDDTLDRERLATLVRQLSSRDPQEREQAFAELAEYGPSAWPVLEQLSRRQPPEGRVRLENLLADVRRPRLGVIRPTGKRLELFSRLHDGGVVLFADLVEIARPDGPPRPQANAFISIRPGRPVQLLPPALTRDLAADGQNRQLIAWGDEWLVTGGPNGPQRWLGNHLAPLLRPGEAAFSRFVGIDARGRWLFADDAGRTLIIDPTLPDATPRLPVWVWNPGGEAGATDTGWPAVRSGGVFVLGHGGYRGLATDDSGAPTEAFTNEPPSSRQAGVGRLPPGFELPPEHAAAANRPPIVLQAAGRTFVMPSPGKLLRLNAAGDQVEAVFTRGIPNTWPDAAWVDPAGRVVLRVDNRLHVAFAEGRIPQAIRVLMPVEDLRAAEGQ